MLTWENGPMDVSEMPRNPLPTGAEPDAVKAACPVLNGGDGETDPLILGVHRMANGESAPTLERTPRSVPTQPLRHSTATYDRRQTLQEGRERHGVDLEAVASR